MNNSHGDGFYRGGNDPQAPQHGGRSDDRGDVVLATVLGLCFGGGQTGIGLAALFLAALGLWCFPWLERAIPRERIGTPTLTVGIRGAGEQELKSFLACLGFRTIGWAAHENFPQQRELRCEIRWSASQSEVGVPEFVSALSQAE